MVNKYPLVSIIIDNWNGRKFLIDCLDSINKITYSKFEIIVIDDGSNDASSEIIKRDYPKVNLIRNEVHKGFAEANMEGAWEAKGEYLLFLNNDTTVTSNFLRPLVDLLVSDSKIGAVQPKIKQMVDKEKLDDVATYLTPFGFLYHYGYGEKDNINYNKRIKTFSPKGACFLVKKDTFLFMGGFDKDYYCYFEETNFAWRLWLSGYRIYFEPESVIYHFGGGSLNNQTSLNREYFSARNRLNSFLTNLSIPWLILIVPLNLLFLCMMEIYYLVKGKHSLLVFLPKAVWWNIAGMRKILFKRNFVQKKLRKCSDFSIFKHLLKMPSLKYFLSFIYYYCSVDSIMKTE